MTRCPEMTPAELRVMKALWKLGSASVAEVRAELGQRGNALAYTTVMTLLVRLAAKSAVVVDRTREPFVYRAAFRRESVLGDRLRAFVRDVFDGQADSLVLRLVEDASLTRAELRAIERKIDEAESGSSAPRTPRTAEPRTAEPRTAEPRTAESRTTEPRTTATRTAAPRTTEPRTTARRTTASDERTPMAERTSDDPSSPTAARTRRSRERR